VVSVIGKTTSTSASDVLGWAVLKSLGLGWAFVGLGYNELLN